MKASYLVFLMMMLPTISVMGLASASVASPNTKPESASYQLPHQSKSN
jgi:hypothetical protein